MVITKIKYRSERVLIEWKDNLEDDANKFTVDIKIPPHASFLNAIMGLRKHVNEICEEGLKDKELHKLEITGISFSHTNGIMGAVITAQKILENSNSPLILNTPHKSEQFYSESGEGDPKMLLSPDCIAALMLLCEEAEEYLQKDDVQLNLFGSEKVTK